MAQQTPQKIIPGAPPPTPLSKSQRKRRKGKTKSSEPESPVPESVSAATIENVPELSDLQPGAIAAELVTQSKTLTPKTVEDETVQKPSPIVELINKRLKA